MPVINTAQENFRKVTVATVPATYTAAQAVLLNAAPTSTTGTALLWDINTASVSGTNPSLLYVMPFLVSATTAQTSIGMRLLGWRKYLDVAGTSFWFMPTVLADFTLTFTSGTVPNYTIDVANTRTFSSITQVSGTPAANLYSPATASASNVEPAYAMIDLAGSSYVTAQFKSSGTPDMGTFWANL
jgi:hypothetical protein